MNRFDLPRITTGLAQARDFRPYYDAKAPKALAYRGNLSVSGRVLAVQLELRDNDIVQLPKIRLLDPPTELRFGAPHIESDGCVCYASPATYVIDRGFVLESLVGCIDQAATVLSDILEGRAATDPANEFLAYWQGTPVLVDIDPRFGADAGCIGSLKLRGGAVQIIADDAAALTKRFGNLVVPNSTVEIVVGRIQSTQAAIPASAPWPPKTMKDLVRWLAKSQPDVLPALAKAVARAFNQRQRDITVFVRAAGSLYAFRAPLSKRSSFHSAQGFATAMVGETAVAAITSIKRLTPNMVTESFIATRNLLPGQPGFLGKRFALVGCGAIGGFLAAALVRSGAGMGGGSLSLIDPDRLGAGNLGRHYLGLPDLDAPKADALRAQLIRDYPGVSVSAVPRFVESLSNLTGYDLVINAAGIESVSDWLSHTFRSGGFPPVLHAWIEGNGAVAVAYLEDRPDLACCRCFRTAAPGGQSIFLRDDYEVKESTAGGCDGLFVPFSVAAVLHATALATQLSLDWLASRQSPRLRVTICDPQEPRAVENHDPAKRSACPLCSVTGSDLSDNG
ncbi:MAG: thiF family protein [Nevskia sp.]|nr:thiF family protein [Nevskia sp.]